MSRLEQRIIIGLVGVGALLYAFNMGNVLFWDDADWITNNPCVQEPMSHLSCLLTDQVLAGIGQTSNYYRPFLMLTFAFNWALGGDTPFGYHLISNGLHILNAVLIFLLLRKVLENREQGVRSWDKDTATTIPIPSTLNPATLIAALVALIWLIHPLQTEAVAYISGRGDPLSVTLMLSAILLWLRADRWRWWALPAAVLAILSRETAVLLPLYLTVMFMAFPEVSPRSEEKPRGWWQSLRSALVVSWPFYAISAVYALLRLTVLDFANTLNWYAQSNIYTDSVLVRLWTFLQVLWEYIRLIVAPVGLHMERNVPVLTAPWQYPAFLGIILLGLATWWVVRSWRRGNRVPFFGVMMFLIPLGPSSGIAAPINSLIYEHWLYLSLIGATTLIALYGVRLYEWLASSKKSEVRIAKWLLFLLLTSYFILLSVQTIRRNLIWGSPERLYLQILQYEPGNVRVLNNLANLYADQQKMDDAERYWKAAIDADPAQPAPYHNLGNLERDRGNTDEAVRWYTKAIETNPAFWYAYQNLAAMLLAAERLTEAAAVLQAWQEADPSQPVTYYYLARILAAQGKLTQARTMLEAGLPAARAAGPEYERAFTQLLQQL